MNKSRFFAENISMNYGLSGMAELLALDRALCNFMDSLDEDESMDFRLRFSDMLEESVQYFMQNPPIVTEVSNAFQTVHHGSNVGLPNLIDPHATYVISQTSYAKAKKLEELRSQLPEKPRVENLFPSASELPTNNTESPSQGLFSMLANSGEITSDSDLSMESLASYGALDNFDFTGQEFGDFNAGAIENYVSVFGAEELDDPTELPPIIAPPAESQIHVEPVTHKEQTVVPEDSAPINIESPVPMTKNTGLQTETNVSSEAKSDIREEEKPRRPEPKIYNIYGSDEDDEEDDGDIE